MTWRSAPLKLVSEAETVALAHRLADLLKPGDVILLEGPIGAGKSVFARAALRARGVTEDIPSPTFTLVQTYLVQGVEHWHADLYRLTGPDDLMELGLIEAFETAISFVEWPDRLGPLVRPDSLLITLEAGEDHHHCQMSSASGDWPQRLEALLA